jgi:threonine dehydrogenase-like Zn-dependent dehydrogenase
MRAVVMRDQKLRVDDVADPTPGPGQVLARTVACGICGSDLHTLQHLDLMIAMQARTRPGGPGIDRSRDLVMGHEFSVEVLDFGPGCSRGLPAGSLACSMPVVMSAAGIGTVGYSHDYPGGYGELLVLSEALLLPVPNGLDADLAALTEPMAVGRHAVEKARLSAEDLPLVVGCGPVGLAVIAALKQQGRGPVLAADFSPARRALAARMGADEVIDPAAVSPYERWQDLAWPPGVDRTNPMIQLTGPKPRPGVIFECVGVPGVINAIFEGAMRDTRVVVVGVCMEPDRSEPLLAIGKELNVQYVLGYSPEEFADTLRGIAEGDLDVAPLITGRVGLDGVPQAFIDLGRPDLHAKILVKP